MDVVGEFFGMTTVFFVLPIVLIIISIIVAVLIILYKIKKYTGANPINMYKNSVKQISCRYCGCILDKVYAKCPCCGAVFISGDQNFSIEGLQKLDDATHLEGNNYAEADEKILSVMENKSDTMKVAGMLLNSVKSIKCPYCGATNPNMYSNCSNCGAKIEHFDNYFPEEDMMMFARNVNKKV